MSDLWDNLDVEQEEQITTEIVDYKFISDSNTDHAWVVTTPALSLKERVGVLFGKTVPVEVTEKTSGYLLNLTDEQRREKRQWVLECDPDAPVTASLTPREQMAKEQKILSGYKRQHRPELIEAIKALKENDTITVKLPKGRSMTRAQKAELAKVISKIIAGFSFKPTPRPTVPAGDYPAPVGNRIVVE